VLGQDTRRDAVELVDVFEDRVVGRFRVLDTKLLQRHETRVRLAEDGVAVAL
jgi:hypothetical protein